MLEINTKEILSDVKNQFQKNENGEPQAWIELNEKDRSIEITHEKDGLLQDEQFYSLRLHCSNDEFDNDIFHSSMGIIDVYNTESVSDEQLIEGVKYLAKVNQKY